MWMNSFTRSSLLCPGATLKEVCKRRHNWNNNFILHSDQQTWFRLAFKMYMLGFHEAPKDTQSEINFWWFFVFGKRRENFMACLQRCHFFHSWCCWEIVAGKLEQRLRWLGRKVATRGFMSSLAFMIHLLVHAETSHRTPPQTTSLFKSSKRL